MRNTSDNFFYLIIFLSGFIFSLLLFKVDFAFIDYKIAISDLLSLSVTSIVGIYLGKKIQEHQSSERFEKEYIIGEVIRIKDMIDREKCFKSFNEIPFKDVKVVFKELNIQIQQLQLTLDDSNFRNTTNTQEIRKCFQAFRKSILNISPENENICPSYANVIEINKEYKKMRRELFRLIININ